jgi:hypothetical protein
MSENSPNLVTLISPHIVPLYLRDNGGKNRETIFGAKKIAEKNLPPKFTS